MITVRKANANDCNNIGKLIYDTVHHGLKDYEYTKEQLFAWAPNKDYYSRCYFENKNQCCYVAYEKDLMVGFGCVNMDGYISAIYTHHNYWRQKIASKIVDVMEAKALELGNKLMTVESAIPAMPLFKFKGFMLENEQVINYNGQDFVCYKMHKKLF